MGKFVQAPPPPPVSLAEMKALIRAATSEEDALIAALVRSAAEACEAFTGRALVARAVSEIVPAGGGWVRLARAPVRSIETVEAIGAEGAAEALAAGDYEIDVDAAGDGWVRARRGGARRLRVAYVAGLAADANGVPEPLRLGVARLAAFLYAARETSSEPPAAVTALWRPWRRLSLSGAARPCSNG